MPPEPGLLLNVTEIGKVTVVRFLDRRIVGEGRIQRISTQLCNLVDEEGRERILVDFAGVEAFSSAGFGALVKLNNRLGEHSGQLKLCNIGPEVRELFEITRFTHSFEIYEDDSSALSTFH